MPHYSKHSFHSNISHNDTSNLSLDPVISEEDAQLENDIPTIEIVEVNTLQLQRDSFHKHVPTQHNAFVMKIRNTQTKLEDPGLNLDLELHENIIKNSSSPREQITKVSAEEQ